MGNNGNMESGESLIGRGQGSNFIPYVPATVEEEDDSASQQA